MATLTSTGVICSNGTLDGYYTGTSASNSSFPIGSYIIGNIFVDSTPGGNVNATVSPRTYGGQTFTISGGGTVLAGTWRNRGNAVLYSCQYGSTLMQRVA